MLSISIDWLAVNFKGHTREAEHFMLANACSGDALPTKPRFGYSEATIDDCGTVVQWNVDRPDMGHHVIFAGSALRNIFERGKSDPQTLLRAVHDAGGRISRLDLALDSTGETVDLSAIYQSLEQGFNTGNSRTFGQIRSNNDGHTVYIGSRQSERFIRIYNKGAQQGMPDDLWFRMELETKGMVARSLAALLLQQNDWASVFGGMASKMVDFSDESLLKAFRPSGLVVIGFPKIEKQTDREKWIEEQVIDAVVKHFAEHPDSRAVSRLMSTLDTLKRLFGDH